MLVNYKENVISFVMSLFDSAAPRTHLKHVLTDLMLSRGLNPMLNSYTFSRKQQDSINTKSSLRMHDSIPPFSVVKPDKMKILH